MRPNNTTTTEDRVSLHPTIAQAKRLRRRGKAQESLTRDEIAICNLYFMTEFADRFIDLIVAVGGETVVGKHPGWKDGERIVESGPSTLTELADGYREMLQAVIETPGAAEGIVRKLHADLVLRNSPGDQAKEHRQAAEDAMREWALNDPVLQRELRQKWAEQLAVTLGQVPPDLSEGHR